MKPSHVARFGTRTVFNCFKFLQCFSNKFFVMPSWAFKRRMHTEAEILGYVRTGWFKTWHDWCTYCQIAHSLILLWIHPVSETITFCEPILKSLAFIFSDSASGVGYPFFNCVCLNTKFKCDLRKYRKHNTKHCRKQQAKWSHRDRSRNGFGRKHSVRRNCFPKWKVLGKEREKGFLVKI